MPSPVVYRAAMAALLAWATLAEAQQPPVVRVRREQELVLARVPAGSEPEIRVAPDNPTLLRFDAEVVHLDVKGEASGQVVWRDVAGHSLVLEPRRELASGERLLLEVVLAQGQARSRLRFQLVSHPGEVDARVDVQLRPRANRQEPDVPPPQHEGGPFSQMVFSGVMGMSGITVGMFQGKLVSEGVIADRPRDYRAERGRAISFRVHNDGAHPWFAAEAVPLPLTGEVPEAGCQWKVSMAAPIEPGEKGLVVVESVGEGARRPVRLEVREARGSRNVRIEESH